MYKEQLKSQARESSGVDNQFKAYVSEAMSQHGRLLDNILQNSPFNSSTPEYKNLKISVLLTSSQILRTKKKLVANPQSVILWHLPKSMSSYTKIILKEYFMAIKDEIMDCYKESNISETDLENILASASEDNNYHEDQY